MAKRELNVFLYEENVGTLTGSGSLITGFKYRSGYSGPAVSNSMPIVSRNVGRGVASSWFTGLLPEGDELRKAMAEAYGSRDTTSIGLLTHAGLDCAGAVQLTSSLELPSREQQFAPIDDTEIGMRLRAANNGQPVVDDSERWAVAGQQGKIALHQSQEGQWGRALGGLPTTHIIKPGITFVGSQSIKDQALTEHLTLAAAKALGISAAKSEFYEFDGMPAVVVSRYDRVWVEDLCFRIHQEDLCQALGIGPSKKYEENGGPGVARAASFLNEVADSSEQSAQFRLSFAMMVMFNHFSGSPDAHAKNYSILTLPNGATDFAPMYDAASGLGYSYLDSGKPRFPRGAMRIGAHDHFARVTENDWEAFAKNIGLPFEVIRSERDRIAQGMSDTFRTLLDGNIPLTARNRLMKSPLLPRMEELCKIT